MTEYAKDTRRIGGAFTVDENAKRLMHYRFAERVCAMTGAAWAPTVGNIKLKFALAEYAYHDTTHYYALGERLPELRVVDGADLDAPPGRRGSSKAEPPNEAFLKFVDALQNQGDPLLRIVGLYRVFKTHLAVNYRYHAQATDLVSDAPTVRILNHILLEEEEHLRWGQAIYEELANSAESRQDSANWQGELESLLITAGGVSGLDGC